MQKTISVVNLSAIRKNALLIKRLLGGRKFYAVVKADAYGHGAEEVAREISDVADGFCVAIIDEGAALRVAGVSSEILVLTPPLSRDDVSRAQFYGLTLTVNSAETALMCRDMAVHVKVNTGMNRLGCNLSQLPEILENIKTENLKGIYSHLYAPQDKVASQRQLALFDEAESRARRKNSDVCAHISASGGLLRGGDFLKDGARCGILLYGYAPAGFGNDGFTPALKVYARRTQITPFIGGGAGYGEALKNYENLSCYRLGYADGFSRTVPLGEGNLCMDSYIREGGGETECVMDDADEYAKRRNTISYEVLTSVTRRSERVYVR